MHVCRRSWLCALVLTTSALALLLIGGHPSAQPTPPTPAAPSATAPFSLGLSPADTDPFEMTPRLFSGPQGETLRLWQRLVPPDKGRVLLAAESEGEWKPLLEIAPQEENTTVGMGDLSVGPAGQLAVAYQWWRRLPSSAKQIRVARSSDGGKTWIQSPTQLDQSDKAFSPKAAWGRDQNLVVVWSDEIRGNRIWDIYARRSTDGGATWEPEQHLSRFAVKTPTDAYVRPELISDGKNTFWTVWVGIRGSWSRLYLNRSTDGGHTWTDPVELSWPGVTTSGHRVFRSGERLLVIWNDRRTGRDRVYAVTSSDGGVSWTAPARVDHSSEDAQTDAVAPATVMNPSGEVLVVWHDGRYGRDDIFVARSTDWGRTWEDKDVRLDMDEPGTSVSRFASIARAADGRVAVAWEDDRAGWEGVYLRVRGAGPRSAWGPEMLVAPPGAKKACRMPVVFWGKDGSLKLAWEVLDYTRSLLAPKRNINGRTVKLEAK